MTAASLLPITLPPAAAQEGKPASASTAKDNVFSSILQMLGNGIASPKDAATTDSDSPPPDKKTATVEPPEADASVTSTILAMMNQPPAPPIPLPLVITKQSSAPPAAQPLETRQPISAPDLTLKVAPKETALPTVTTNETPQTSSLPSVEAPPTAEKKAVAPPVAEKQTAPPPVAVPATASLPTASTTADPAVASDAVSVLSTSGTGVALDKSRMKFASEKKEIAGSTVQKVPISSNGGSDPARSIAAVDAESDSDHAKPDKDSIDPSLVGGWSAKQSDWNTELSKGMSNPATLEHPAAQVERVAQLVNQEVTSFRQTGASTLAVSLKVDSHTELFLQLTTHNGQIEASLRCDRGDAAGLDTHWNDLQASLSKQNVHLLPMEGKIPMVEASSSANFDQAPQNPQRDKNDLWRDFPLHPPIKTAPVAAVPLEPSISTSTSTSRLGWESWA